MKKQKKFKLFSGPSKSRAKWWIMYTIETGEWKALRFPTKVYRQMVIDLLKEQGYTEIKD